MTAYFFVADFIGSHPLPEWFTFENLALGVGVLLVGSALIGYMEDHHG